MKGRDMRIVFSSGITDISERNSSFDSGKLRIAYTGKNRNNSFISKETFEHCMSSIYNCPIVCRYDRDEDEIGSHDVELVSDADGNMRVINVTQPVGMVPESANYWWEEIEDESGIHEYLCVDVILWKRQEAYRKIKENGITDESMEISVQDGKMVNGVYIINKFEFTAFCLLGTAEPCFESASLEVFSCNDFKQQLADMMQEFKESFSKAQSSHEVGIEQEVFSEGGEKTLNEKLTLMKEFGLTENDIDFSIDELSVDELRAKFEAMQNTDADGDSEKSETGTDNSENKFELDNQFMQELFNALEAEQVSTEYGQMPRYWYVNCDRDTSEVYAEDYSDGWNLYGFPYSMNGDHVVIDFACKKRKKYSIVDFDEGEVSSPTSSLFNKIEEKFSAAKVDWDEKYQKAVAEASANNDELVALRQFKSDALDSVEQSKRDELLAQFDDLNGIDAFEQLRKTSKDYSVDELEEKCFAIRGRHGTMVKFSQSDKAPKLPVEKRNINENEPYGGIFAEYGIVANN